MWLLNFKRAVILIKTEIINKDPYILHHQVTELNSEVKTREGVMESLKTVDKTGKPFHLIIDVKLKTDSPYSLTAHRIWATGFRENEKVVNNVLKSAVVGEDSPTFRLEKRHLETESLRFFNEFRDALNWIKGE